jgi:hypothetical protein
MKSIRFRQLFRLWGLFVAFAAVAAFVLGVRGFKSYYEVHLDHTEPTAGDIIYRTLQLFSFGCESLSRPIPWQLETARFLAGFVELSAVVAALLKIFHDRLKQLRLRFYRNHTVVCGLGPGEVELVTDLRNHGKRVVVIESQASHPDLERCREQEAMSLGPVHPRNGRPGGSCA